MAIDRGYTMLHTKSFDSPDMLFRHISNQDEKDFITLVTNPLYGQFSPFGTITQQTAQDAFKTILSNYENETYEFWAVIDKKANTFAGFSGFYPVSFEDQLEEMFFMGLQQQYWEGFFSLNVAKLACNDAFTIKKIPKLISFINPSDIASLNCAIQLGAQFEKTTKFFGTTVFLFSIEKNT